MAKRKSGYKQTRVRINSGKNRKKREAGLKKVLSGVLFAAACFVAVFVLLEFHNLYWLVGIMCVLLMGAAYFFLTQIFADKEDAFDDLLKAQEALEEVKEEDRQRADDEFKKAIEEQVRSLDKTSRAMFVAMKKNAEAQGENLEQMRAKLDQVIDEQNAGVKTIIKYNKENARQIAESDKNAIEKMSESITGELKATRNSSVTPVMVQAMPGMPMYPGTPAPMPAMDIPAAAPAMDTAAFAAEPAPAAEPDISFDADLAAALENATEAESEAVEPETVTEPEISLDADLAAALENVTEAEPEATAEPEVAEAVAEPEPIPEPEVVAEAEPEPIPEAEVAAEPEPEPEPVPEPEVAAAEPAADDDPLAGLASAGVDLSDPNASLSPDDIAKLFAAASDPAPAPAPEPEPAADDDPLAGLASAGVDLSDPNASLSADDIAKLFAAAGN